MRMQHGAMLYSTMMNQMVILILQCTYDTKTQKTIGNVNGFLGEVDEMDLFEIKPDNIPTHISNHFAIFCPGGKRKS